MPSTTLCISFTTRSRSSHEPDGVRDLCRALVAHGIISVPDLPAEKHPIYAA